MGKVVNLATGHQFAQGLPEKDILYKNIQIAVAEYEAQRRDFKKAKGQTLAPVADVSDALSAADALLQSLSNNRLTPIGDEYEQHRLFKKQLAQIQRALVLDESKLVPFGPKTVSLIHLIALLVVNELNDMARMDIVQYSKYTTGQDRVYWFKTTTQSLCTSLNRAKVSQETLYGSSKDRRTDDSFQSLCASFRGTDGFYAAMIAAGFLTEKVNLDRSLNDHEDGQDVRLGVNLDWIFAFSANIFTAELERAKSEKAAQIAQYDTENPFLNTELRGNSSHLGLNISFGNKETEYKMNGAAEPQESSALEGAQKKNEESEEKATRSNDYKKNEEKTRGGAAAFVEKPEVSDNEVLMNCANDSAKRALKSLFNRKNLENGRIRYNQNSNVASFTQQDYKDFAFWVADVYRAVRKTGETWLDVAKLINEAIENTTQYLGEHPTRWLYHPRFWLNPTFTGGALINYLNDYLSRPTYQKTEKTAAKTLDFGDYSPQIAWFLQAGANRDALKFQIRRIGEQAVSDCIALGGAKMHNGAFKPKNGKLAYIFGIIKHCKPETIAAQAAIAKEKALGKTPKKAAIWTPERVRSAMETAVKNPTWRALVTETMIQQVADKYAYMNASEAQIGDIFYQYCYKNQ